MALPSPDPGDSLERTASTPPSKFLTAQASKSHQFDSFYTTLPTSPYPTNRTIARGPSVGPAQHRSPDLPLQLPNRTPSKVTQPIDIPTTTFLTAPQPPNRTTSSILRQLSERFLKPGLSLGPWSHAPYRSAISVHSLRRAPDCSLPVNRIMVRCTVQFDWLLVGMAY